MKTTIRIRNALAAVVLAATIAAPATLAVTASPADASRCYGTQCFPLNHNEEAAADEVG